MEMIPTGAQFMFQALRSDPILADHLSRLRIALPLSWELIERSECWRFKYKAIDVLLPQLKDAAYKAHTILDEFEYEELKKRIQGLNRSFPGELISSSLTNLRNWMSGSTTKVKEVRERLDSVYVYLRETCDRHGIPENPNQFSTTARPVTSSFITEAQVFGRDKELDEAIRLLRVPSGSSSRPTSAKRARKGKRVDLAGNSSVGKKENVHVLPIVGIGGVGKTTFAQMVCSNEHVKSHFELIIWVYVSNNFDVSRLTAEIIECVTKRPCDINNLDVLQVTLKKMLGSKRFLLVLDDIWSENRTDWDRLFTPLKEGCEGSMVIVTTRSRKVAEITGTVMGPIVLEGLEEGIYWEFFTKCAFGLETNSESYPELKEIANQIVVKLKRSPLAAKTIGGLLRTDLSVRHWKNIKDSEIWELKQEEHGILSVLQLSYQYLPSHLKKLFSFCSLFPKDYSFDEFELIIFWIGEGFIDPQQKQQMEVVAKGHIDELISRGFFQQVPNYLIKQYVIHDLMHDVAQSITKDECFRVENENCEKIKSKSKHIWHLSVFNAGLGLEKLKEIRKYKKLYSLIFHKCSIYGINTITRGFSEVTNICFLSLPKYSGIKKMPESIGNLRHLRSLDISYAKIERLPNSFCNLYKLEFLNMEHCDNFQCFPQGSNRLISVKMLILPLTKIQLVSHIPNLANALQIEDLCFDAINRGEDTNIEELKYMNKIYGTASISKLENVFSKEEAERAQLNNKEFVDNLYLSWMGLSPFWGHSSQHETHEKALEGLCPHSNLKELVIDGYGGEILPSWLTTERLPNLTTIEFTHWRHIKIMPSLHHSITKVTFDRCNGLTSLHNCLVPSNLPSVKKIDILGCEELVSIPVETFDEFSFLQELTIRNCPNLIYPNQMVLPPSLQKLELDSCGGPLISNNLQNLTSLTTLIITDCPKLRCSTEMVLPPSIDNLELESCGDLEERVSSSLQNLTSLTSLRLLNCQRLTSIPHHVIDNLESLRYLEVQDCRELQSIGGRQFLSSLEESIIEECPKLEETKGENWHKRGMRFLKRCY